jgi:hypothetical protein
VFTSSSVLNSPGRKIPLQVDIGFGDAVYPEPELATFPVLLPMSAPIIRAYPREASIADGRLVFPKDSSTIQPYRSCTELEMPRFVDQD